MKRIAWLLTFSLAIAFGGISAAEAQELSSHKLSSNTVQAKDNVPPCNKFLMKKAKRLGINPEGMSNKELNKAVNKAHKKMLKKRAKALGINPSGKSEFELHMAIHEKMMNNPSHLNKMANKLGISTEGKSKEKLKAEVKKKFKAKHHKHLVKWAKKLDIKTKGKSDMALHKEIKMKLKEKCE
ncbi:hypothetical protein ACFO4N_12100 [Camelliibacillus cellulosilyticus]|uniref:DUF4142 domain-containing protein n=1 Tax=Camelliibacillus cellulosilyticus TaxID=2174486 RepID=A0ABV9GMJ4_9BACL